MRDLFKTVMTSSMVAGAALLVVACGGGAETEANNMTATELDATDPMMDGTTNDVTAIDGAAGTDANMAMDTNMTMDANMTGMNGMDANMTGTDANMTNGM